MTWFLASCGRNHISNTGAQTTFSDLQSEPNCSFDIRVVYLKCFSYIKDWWKRIKIYAKNVRKKVPHVFKRNSPSTIEDGLNSIQFQLLFELWKKSYLWQTCEKLSHLYVLLSFSTYRYNLHTTTHDHLSWFHGKV